MTTTASATTDHPHPDPRPPRSTAFSRLGSLARAETLQFLRNRTLIFMAVLFPLGMPLAIYAITVGSAPEEAGVEGVAAGLAVEMFLVFGLMFVQYYSVLSMATTRRDERVLKRLRTGEARDTEILAALCAPGAVMTVLFAVIVAVVLLVAGAPAPANILPLLPALLLGLVVSSALALLTSAFTRNAEAAQMTSMPVMVLALVSMASIRDLLPESLAGIIDRTPFALIYDLGYLSWNGTTYAGQMEGAPALGAGEVLADAAPSLLVLLLWTIAIVYLGRRKMRWDTHR